MGQGGGQTNPMLVNVMLSRELERRGGARSWRHAGDAAPGTRRRPASIPIRRRN